MVKTDRKFLEDVYELADAEATQSLYRDWAQTYDAELIAAGYVGPRRCAVALADVAEDKAAPVLDIGCGTGLSGEALKQAGFACVDGTDFSEEMLKTAGCKGIYRKVFTGDLNNPLPGSPGDYAHISAVGVFSPGHAPPELIDAALGRLGPGGCFVFTLNDHALSDKAYEGRLREVIDAGMAELVFKEHGDHVPGADLFSTVYVLRKR